MNKNAGGNSFNLDDLLAGEAGTGAKSNSFNAKQVDVFAFDNVEVK